MLRVCATSSLETPSLSLSYLPLALGVDIIMMHQDATSPLETTTTACTIAAATAVACTVAAAAAACTIAGTAAAACTIAAAACTIAVAAATAATAATAAYRANDGADYARCPLSPRYLSTALRRRAKYSRSM